MLLRPSLKHYMCPRFHHINEGWIDPGITRWVVGVSVFAFLLRNHRKSLKCMRTFCWPFVFFVLFSFLSSLKIVLDDQPEHLLIFFDLQKAFWSNHMGLPVLSDKIDIPSSHRIFNFCLLIPRHLKDYWFHHWIVDDEALVFGDSFDISLLFVFFALLRFERTGHFFKEGCFDIYIYGENEKKKYGNVEKVFWRILPFRTLFDYWLCWYDCRFARVNTPVILKLK